MRRVRNNPEMQRDFICAYLSREAEVWLGERAIVERSSGYNLEARGRMERSMKMIDQMLDELIEVNGGTPTREA